MIYTAGVCTGPAVRCAAAAPNNAQETYRVLNLVGSAVLVFGLWKGVSIEIGVDTTIRII